MHLAWGRVDEIMTESSWRERAGYGYRKGRGGKGKGRTQRCCIRRNDTKNGMETRSRTAADEVS